MRHLIRKEQQSYESAMDHFLENNRDNIDKLVSIGEAQVERGEFATVTAQNIIVQGRARRAKTKKHPT